MFHVFMFARFHSMYTHTHAHTRMHAHTHARMHSRMHAHTHTHTNTHTHTHTHICMHARTCTLTHTHTHTFYCSTMALGATVNRTVVLTLPGDLTLFDFDFLSIWCDTADVNFGEVPIPAIERVLIGSLSELLHDVSGTVYALGERTLMITDFNFDGDAPGQYSTYRLYYEEEL